MPILSSSYKASPPEDDSRRYVVERHTDHIGREHLVTYMCPSSGDPVTILAARATSLGTQIDDLLSAESVRSRVFDGCGPELIEALTWLVINIRTYPNVSYATATASWNAVWADSLFTFERLTAWVQKKFGNITWAAAKTYMINHTFREIDG